ncbi:MAG: imelysin family protein [Burkholderiaceae bacterium]
MHTFRRRSLIARMAALPLVAALPAWAQQPGTVVAFPYYTAEHALQGLYTKHLPPLLQAFETQARALTAAARQQCSGQVPPAALSEAWSRARLAWMAVANPALGPVITRRTQREIDFWPLRPPLLKRAIDGKPQTAGEMRRIGGPAKGFPAIEALLAGEPSPAHCPYLALVAEAIEFEAGALRKEFEVLGAKDWSGDEDAARASFAEWINQWLGGLENLRWQQIEQPVQKGRTASKEPAFARKRFEDNRADWNVQWESLRAQARLKPGERNAPPQPGQALVSIEALLLGKGQMALAEKWGKAIDAASAAMGALPAQPGEKDFMALSARLKAVTSLYQGEVAPALDVPLGFSSADGD